MFCPPTTDDVEDEEDVKKSMNENSQDEDWMKPPTLPTEHEHETEEIEKDRSLFSEEGAVLAAGSRDNSHETVTTAAAGKHSAALNHTADWHAVELVKHMSYTADDVIPGRILDWQSSTVKSVHSFEAQYKAATNVKPSRIKSAPHVLLLPPTTRSKLRSKNVVEPYNSSSLETLSDSDFTQPLSVSGDGDVTPVPEAEEERIEGADSLDDLFYSSGEDSYTYS